MKNDGQQNYSEHYQIDVLQLREHVTFFTSKF